MNTLNLYPSPHPSPYHRNATMECEVLHIMIMEIIHKDVIRTNLLTVEEFIKINGLFKDNKNQFFKYDDLPNYTETTAIYKHVSLQEFNGIFEKIYKQNSYCLSGCDDGIQAIWYHNCYDIVDDYIEMDYENSPEFTHLNRNFIININRKFYKKMNKINNKKLNNKKMKKMIKHKIELIKHSICLWFSKKQCSIDRINNNFDKLILCDKISNETIEEYIDGLC